MTKPCPSCGQPARDDAVFCGTCGVRLSTPRQPAPPPQPMPVSCDVQQAAAPGPTYIPSPPPAPVVSVPPPQLGAAAQAPSPPRAAAAGQAARAAAQKSWEIGKQGMSWIGRLVTGGGRAAYSEIFRRVPVVEGFVITQPQVSPVTAPLEPAAFLFVVASFLIACVLLANQALFKAVMLLGLWVGLLAINRLGVRRPCFSRLTGVRLKSLFARKARRSIQQVRFTVNNQATNQPVDIVMAGARQGLPPAYGQWVRVCGIVDPSRNEVRAWCVEAWQQNRQPLPPYVADRLMPLSVALFVPLILVTIIGLLLIF